MLNQKRLILLILSVSVFSFSAYAVASNEFDDTEMLLFGDIQSVLVEPENSKTYETED